MTDADQPVTPEGALRLLLERIREFDQRLADDIQVAIDAGHIHVVREATGRRQLVHRETRPLSAIESLDMVGNALRAYFIEAPSTVNAALTEFEAAGLPAGPNQLVIEAFGPGASEIRADAREDVLLPLRRTPDQVLQQREVLIRDIGELARGGGR